MEHGWKSLSIVYCGRLSINIVEPSGPAIRQTDGREVCCEDGRWIELAQDRVQWQPVVLAVLSRQTVRWILWK
jgi:hypothetical protein